MTRLCLSICLLFIIAASVMGQANPPSTLSTPETSSWKRYTVKGEPLSIIFPTVPAMATSIEFSERGDRDRRVREIGAYAEGIVYMVYLIENPAPKQSLESFIKERFGRFKTREVIVSGVTGREPLEPRGDLASQYFGTERHLYAIRTLGAAADDPRVKQFFDSVILRKQNEGIELSDGPGVPYPAAQVEPNDANSATAYVGRDVNRKVRIAMKPQPMYTEQARQHSVTGTVILKVVFSFTGDVNNIRIVSGLPFGLTERAIDAAKEIKFIPALKDGRFVSVWMQLEYNFNLY